MLIELTHRSLKSDHNHVIVYIIVENGAPIVFLPPITQELEE